MNNFRSTILSGAKLGIASPLATAKKQRNGANRDSLISVEVPRHETRSVNQREEDRHRLAEDQVAIRHGNGLCKAQLINLSSGGAMIVAPISPNIWDRVDLLFDKTTRIESAVIWIRAERIGLEFAHETGIDCAPALRTEILRKVIERNYPNHFAEPVGSPAPAEEVDEAGHAPRNHRHPLVFSAEVHFDHDSSRARLHNVSATGALIETGRSFPLGSEILLDLGDPGALFATVSWARGDKCGLQFRQPFDIERLANARTEIVRPQADASDPARLAGEGTPWAAPWRRASIDTFRRRPG